MSTKAHHIVILSSEFPPQPGGIGNHANNLALSFVNQGYKVNVISDQRSKSGTEESEFDQDLPFKVHRIRRQSVRIIMYIKRFLKMRQHFKQASVVIATGKFSLWVIAFLSLFSQTKCIAVVHGTEVNFKSYLLRKSVELALKKFHHIIAVSNYTKSLIAHLKLPVTVIPNGINTENWNSIRIDEKSIVGDPILTTVGHVSERKGQLNVIKALPKLSKRYPNVHYHCIGIPTAAELFVETAKSLQVDHLITFHGSLDTSDLKEILAQTDIFVMLSSESKTGDVEGFGIAILEANAMGVPAIGSLNCGIEDAILEGSSGRLIQSHDDQALLNAVEDILNQKEHYKKGAHQWAEQHDWSSIIKSYISQL